MYRYIVLIALVAVVAVFSVAFQRSIEVQTYTTTGRTFFEGWTPAAGTSHLDARVKCDSTEGGTGVAIKNDNVTLVNPYIYGDDFGDCARGKLVNGGDNLKIVFDPTQQGYYTAARKARPALSKHTTAIRIWDGSNVRIEGINGGKGYFRNNYRPIEFEYARGLTIKNLDIRHPLTYNWAGRGNGAIVGIKGLAAWDRLDATEKSMRDIEISSNFVGDVFEEGISLDPKANDPAQMFPRGGGTVKAVSAATDTVDLGSGWGDISSLKSAYLLFNDGTAAGRHLKITAINNTAKRITLSDPNNHLSSVAVGDSITAGALYINARVENNRVEATKCRTHYAFGGTVVRSTLKGNASVGLCEYVYPSYFHLRKNANGNSVPQAMRIAGWNGSKGGLTPNNTRVIINAYNSVTDNTTEGDISHHLVGLCCEWAVPSYQSGNVTTQGQVYNDGNYHLLLSARDP